MCGGCGITRRSRSGAATMRSNQRGITGGDFQKESMYLRADYIRLFEEILPRALREADDETFYWPSSPSSGGCFDEPDDEKSR